MGTLPPLSAGSPGQTVKRDPNTVLELATRTDGVDVATLVGPKTNHDLSRTDLLAVYLLRVETRLNASEIARIFAAPANGHHGSRAGPKAKRFQAHPEALPVSRHASPPAFSGCAQSTLKARGSRDPRNTAGCEPACLRATCTGCEGIEAAQRIRPHQGVQEWVLRAMPRVSSRTSEAALSC